ncbi:MAG: rod shape-determining protein MreD [Pseudomonadota bacterium]|nr:rod shape-determining protein MreD [Pseudomonadota bacterium]
MALPRVPPLMPLGPEVILKPASIWFVLFTLCLAAAGNLMPVTGLALQLRPDFVVLVLLYWCVHEPRLIGVGAAWLVGLVMDVADATVFGQHALAYAALAYAAIYFRRRILRFPLWQQAAQIVILLVLTAVLMALIRVIGGARLPPLIYLASPFIGGALWPALSVIFQTPQQPRRSASDF